MILTDPSPPWVPHWTSGAIIITAPAITWGPASAFIVIIMSGLALSGANLRRPVTLVVERRLLVAFLPTLGWAAGIVVRIWDLQRVIVPLTYFIEKPFRNWTNKEHRSARFSDSARRQAVGPRLPSCRSPTHRKAWSSCALR
jgi:hypothetical protein